MERVPLRWLGRWGGLVGCGGGSGGIEVACVAGAAATTEIEAVKGAAETAWEVAGEGSEKTATGGRRRMLVAAASVAVSA